MRTRVIHLKKYFGEPYIIKGINSLGKYRSFGFYDAIDISKEFDMDISDKRNQWHVASQTSVQNLNANNYKRDLICFTDDKASDDFFWKQAMFSPILFITLARIDKEWDDESNNYLKIIHKEQSEYLNNHSMIYFTSIHSEFVVVTYGESFSQCKDKAVDLLRKYGCLKLYSIFSVAETEVENPSHIVDESVKCRLKVIVRDPKRIEDFVSKLKLIIGTSIDAQWAVGKSDMIIDIHKISKIIY